MIAVADRLQVRRVSAHAHSMGWGEAESEHGSSRQGDPPRHGKLDERDPCFCSSRRIQEQIRRTRSLIVVASPTDDAGNRSAAWIFNSNSSQGAPAGSAGGLPQATAADTRIKRPLWARGRLFTVAGYPPQ